MSEAKSRECEACGKRLTRHRYADGHLEAPKKFARRRFCPGAVCRAVVRRVVRNPPERHCKACGEPLVRHAYSSQIESISSFLKRDVCSSACRYALVRAQYPAACPVCGGKPESKGYCHAHGQRVWMSREKARLSANFLKNNYRLPADTPPEVIAVARSLYTLRNHLKEIR